MNPVIIGLLSVVCFCISAIMWQCLFTNKTIFDLFKSTEFRLVSNGTCFKIQQKCLIFFWVDYYGFAVKREDGVIDISLTDRETAVATLEALRKQVEEKKHKKWIVQPF